MQEIFRNLRRSITLTGVALALAVSALYLWGLAADRYAVESRFTVKSQGEMGGPAGLDFGIFGGSSVAKQDQLIIRDFLLSYDMMQEVEKEFGVDQLSAPKIDVLWHIGEESRGSSKLSHYRSLVDYTYDEEASVSKIVTQGFSPEMALKLNAFLLKSAEDYINDFSESSSRSFIDFAEKDVSRARKQVEDVNERIRQAQDAGQLVGPETELQVVATNLAELEARLAEARGELAQTMSVYQDDTWEVKSGKLGILELEGQVRDLRARMASRDGEEDLAQASVLFASLESELEFANADYASALKTLELAKLQSMKARKHLVIVESPDLPDFPEYPRKLLWILVVSTGLAVFLLLARGSMAILREY